MLNFNYIIFLQFNIVKLSLPITCMFNLSFLLRSIMISALTDVIKSFQTNFDLGFHFQENFLKGYKCPML
jgi:hypothetical protein